jgi:TRAP-type mannitol/chloroaromatic compound transport system permease large subunit
MKSSLNRLALTASLHCLAGCVIGEVLGMVIGTALGWGTVLTTATAVLLAFLFGYGLTSLPLFRARMPTRRVVGTALGSDTASIATMEAVDNAFILAVPGAMEAGLADGLFWGSILGGFALALPVAFIVNRALIRRGKGHALVHEAHGTRRS